MESLFSIYEMAKSITLRRLHIVIRIGLQVAGGQQWFMEQTLTNGNGEKGLRGAGLAQESDYTSAFQQTSLFTACKLLNDCDALCQGVPPG